MFWFIRSVREIVKSGEQLRHNSPSIFNYSAPTGRVFMKFDVIRVFQKSVEKIQVSLKSDKNDWYFT
jgi:hypothetical protein